MPRRLNEASERAEIEQLGRDNDTIALTGKTAEQMVQLISALDDSTDASNAADARLEWLTKWLVGLTCVLVVLTIALLARIVIELAQNRPPQVVEVTYERLAEWTRRIHTPTSSTIVGLGWGAEYWDPDPTHYEGWVELRDRYKALGRKKTQVSASRGIVGRCGESFAGRGR